jgi:hypothetical protein
MGKVKVAKAQEHKVKVAKVEKHQERVIETISKMPYDIDCAMDWNRRYRFVMRDGGIIEMNATDIEEIDGPINIPVSVTDILVFAAYSPNEFDEFIQLYRQALEETRITPATPV